MDQQQLVVRYGSVRGNLVETDWFETRDLESVQPPLAICGDAEEPATRRYRGRYRFSVTPRSGYRVFQAEAHWQAAPGVGPPRWEDCRSTGVWEQATEARIVLRAGLLGQEN